MLGKISLKLFGNLVQPYLGYFDTLKTNLKKAKIKQSIHEYLCTLLFLSLIAFIVSLIFGSFFITIATTYIVYSYTLSIIISFVASGLFFFVGIYYPSLTAKTIERQMDKSLPFSAFYMTTIASSGINPVEIFKVLSLRKGIIADEAKRIYTDVKTIGLNLTTALQKAATKSPSPSFSDLLWGMISIITTGGDMETYLKNKTATLMAQYRRSLNDYSKTISLYTEIYITMIIVGSLFFIILLSLVSPMVGISVIMLQTFIVFFFVPLVSVGFIVLLKSISPEE